METFDAVIETEGRGACVVVPAAVVAALGGGGRIPVTATLAGIAYQGQVVSMGGRMLIGVTKAVQTAAGVAPGDTIAVTLLRETAARTIDVPADLRAALVAAGVSDAFDRLAPSHRKEYVRWVEDAKKPETRAKRVAGAVDKLSA